jgi:hypothetical protein
MIHKNAQAELWVLHEQRHESGLQLLAAGTIDKNESGLQLLTAGTIDRNESGLQ